MPSPDDSAPRVMPRSWVIGIRNTPNAKIRMEPAPTTKPQIDATTTHQRFASSPDSAMTHPPQDLLPPPFGFAGLAMSESNRQTPDKFCHGVEASRRCAFPEAAQRNARI